VRTFLKLLLTVALLLAHAPARKATATDAHLTPNTPQQAPQCCAKCAKNNPVHAPPKPEKPTSPKPCEPGCTCSLCTTPAAVMPDAIAPADLDSPSTEQLCASSSLPVPDGFRTLLDRPPRA
jgi:hypothetical protein